MTDKQKRFFIYQAKRLKELNQALSRYRNINEKWLLEVAIQREERIDVLLDFILTFEDEEISQKN